ncbi:pantoate--beta-alanine ligase [Ornithinibacillus sp. L9]|uniref:Pantothenate synthetase n=1 Tax=Ornithinibacillus caprae TaxID=2678566 RepID=A0A6N8FEC6_9BACI|nr:pantoate--beta-alanine ligase [Ornithinibacillus caprae]MUK87551.1 pantoate--beta-alanine ligase [Ornithinibacillus caprae]
MKVIRSIEEMKQSSKFFQEEKKQIGFVPTMGFLHEGHLNLMREAKKENDVVVASIFVNPLQFGPNEDYEKYPRDEQADTRRAEKVGVDVLFIPSVDEMYPNPMLIQMGIKERVDVLCGSSRPGHFDGVLTVLTKLFHVVRPDSAYFGLKDAQQVAVVDALIRDLNFSVNIVGLPTVREEDGLAKSSRNVNLSEQERKEAIWIYKGLQAGRELMLTGETDPDQIIREVTKSIEAHISGEIDYVELLSYPSLKPVTSINQQVILATAVYYKQARLIDNLLLDKNGDIIERFN